MKVIPKKRLFLSFCLTLFTVCAIVKTSGKGVNMRREFEIKCLAKDVDIIADIAFAAGKGCCGLIFSNNIVHTVYGYGKHSYAVRVYAALAANNIRIISLEGV